MPAIQKQDTHTPTRRFFKQRWQATRLAIWLLLVLLLLAGGCTNPATGNTPVAQQLVPTATAVAPTLSPTVAVTATAGPVIQAAPTPAPSPDNNQWAGLPGATLTIIHTNDIHGHMLPEKISTGERSFDSGGVATLSGYIERIRQDAAGHVLLLDAGDLSQGTYISNLNRGKAMVEFMNLMGYDAIEVGNHEFDWGQDILAQRIGESQMPWLSANITGTTKVASMIKPYIIKQVNGVRVGIIGIILPGTPSIVKFGNTDGLTFNSDVDTLKQLVPELRKQADLVIVLSHDGLDNDVHLAEAVPGIDVIVGGHSHTILQNTRQVNDTLIVQAGSYSKYIGRLDLQLDPQTKKIIAWTRRNELLPVVGTGVTPDPKVVDLVNRYQAVAKEASERVIGQAAIPIDRGPGRGESLLGNLVTDAMLDADAGGHKADIALYNNAGLRADLKQGSITYADLYQVLPFDNVLVSMDLKGELLLKILEESVANSPGNLTIAGAKFVYAPGAPQGKRIVSLTIGGQPFDPNKTYRVQTVDYLAGGGDGHVEFREGTNLAYGELHVDVVAGYITQHSPVNPKLEGRITTER